MLKWQKEIESAFNLSTQHAQHELDQSPLFSDEGLAEILDLYPRDRLGVFQFPPHATGRVKARHGSAGDLSGAELISAVQNGHIWLNLRAVNNYSAPFSEVADGIFGSIEQATGQKTFKRDVGLLISSPNIHVHYHLDIPLVCLVQLRGRKTIHVYPNKPPFAPADQVEAVALREREEDIHFEDTFDRAAEVYELTPGQALTWPQNAPHRVQNADVMNVSLSCEFMTRAALLRANAIYANGRLRRQLGWTPSLADKTTASVVIKAAAAQIAKRVHRPPQAGPTPLTFRVSNAACDVEDLPIDTPPSQGAALQYIIKPVSELSQQECDQWKSLCEGHFAYQSPLLTVEFAQTIGATRPDTRCLLAKEGDRLVGCMAVHVRNLGFARPVGAPFDDISGPITADGYESLTAESFIKAAGLHSYRARASVIKGAVDQITSEPHDESSYIIWRGDASPEAHLEQRRILFPKRFKNFRRLQAKFEREVGPLELRWGVPDRDHLEKILSWKSMQFRREGMLDITAATHGRKVIEALMTADTSQAAPMGFAVELFGNGQLIAGHFGVRWQQHFHPFFAAYDPDYSDYAPGMNLLYKALLNFNEMDLVSYNLAGGCGHYKKYFADPSNNTQPLAINMPTPSGLLQKTNYEALRSIGGRNHNSAGARLSRRMDLIAACEFQPTSRVREFAYAVMNRRQA